jgi:DNA-binding NtrC family response regulator
MATVLCVDDEAPVSVVLENALVSLGHDAVIATSVAEAIEKVNDAPCDLIISDYSMPNASGKDLIKQLDEAGHEIPVIIMTGYGSIENAVELMRVGAIDYLTKPVQTETLRIAVNQAIELTRLRKENSTFRRELSSLKGRRAIVGESSALEGVLDMVAQVAPTKATVLLEGESGTGKELLARAIHEQSPRADNPFITLNCAAMPEGLVESALFGHEKGAFTGASSRSLGAFERATRGTLLLDEISEMRLDLQAKLLRVIQEQEFERVGGTQPIRVDIRIVATTNRNLEEEVAAGRFRDDLFFRLSVVPIHTPPLRERRVDIPLLVRHFQMRVATELDVPAEPIDEDTMLVLQEYDWPGNVRELANVVERAVILSGGKPRMEHFERVRKAVRSQGEAGSGTTSAGVHAETSAETLPLNLGRLEAVAIERALKTTDGHRRKAAELLGISERTLRNKLNNPSKNRAN